jgi:two-component system response regulator FlrC
MKNQCLIVDDNAMVRETTAMLIKHIAGCPVRCCAGAEEALLAFKQEPDAYGCVITDFNMPGMNGLELGGLLRAIAPEVKMLLVTGNPGAVDDGELNENGFHALLPKPFNMSLLRDAIRSFFQPAGNDVPSTVLRSPFEGSFSFHEKSNVLAFAAA